MEDKKIDVLNEVTEDIHQLAKEKGWWDRERSRAEVVALMHSELSEALESMRKDEVPLFLKEDERGNEKPEGWGVELIDCIIRILDFLGEEGVYVGEILQLKHEYNKTRPYKHGKEF